MTYKALRDFYRRRKAVKYRKSALAGGGQREIDRRKRQIADGRLKTENGLQR